jgi:hypothetical protein
MMYVVPFEAAHFYRLDAQDAQRWMMKHPAVRDMHRAEGPYATTLMQDGNPIVCGGAMPIWPGRAHVWSILSSKVSVGNFAAVHRHVVEFLDGLPFRRLEAAVDVDFQAGHRWMRLLEFKCEAPLMEAFDLDGRDCALYARVRR